MNEKNSKMNKKRKLAQAYAKQIGLCSQCFRKDAREGFATCEKCAKINIKNRQRRKGNPANCSRCGKIRDDEKYKTCTSCREFCKKYR